MSISNPPKVKNLINLGDVNSSTPTAGNILRADGTDWESVSLSSYSLLKNGSNTPTANMNWAGFNLSNVGILEVDTQITLSDDITFTSSAVNQLTITASDKTIFSGNLRLNDNKFLYFGSLDDTSISWDSTNNRLEINTPKVYSYVNTGLVVSNYLYDFTYRVTPVSDTTTSSGVLKNDLLLRGSYNNTGYHSAQIIGVYNTNTGTTSTLYGTRLVAYNNYKGTVTTMIAADYDARCRDYDGAGMVTNLYGAKYRVLATTKGNVGTGYGIRIYGGNIGTGSFGTYYGIYIESGLNSSTGSLINSYGLYIANQSNATNNWAIYSAGGKWITLDNIHIFADNKNLYFGAGNDMGLRYDGTYGYIETDLITPSDLKIDCGTEKTIELIEPVWKDINMGSAQLSKPSNSQPDTDKFKDSTGTDTGIETLSFAPNEKVSGSFELQHDYKEGTDFVFHVHWQGITAPTGTDKVQWQVIYTVARDGVVLPAVSTITGETDFDTQYESVRTDLTIITGTNYKIGDQILFQLSRIAASSDEYAGDSLLETIGIHYEIDTIGSRQILIK